VRSVITVAIIVAAAFASNVAVHGEGLEKHFSLLATELDDCQPRPGMQGEDGWPMSCLLLTVPPLADFADLRSPFVGETIATAPASLPHKRGTHGTYALSRRWTAGIAYHHELLSPTAASKDLRHRQFSLFASSPDRDVVDMHLSWRLFRNELDVGYQLQSNRAPLTAAAQSYSLRRLVDDADLNHAVTIGITRRFGSHD
jgi:hypothetical protein